MSRFFKNLFGEKPKAEGAHAPARLLSRDKSVAAGGFIVDEDCLTEEYNGVKLSDIWKRYASLPVNSPEAEEVLSQIISLIKEFYSVRDVGAAEDSQEIHVVIPNSAGHPLRLLEAVSRRICALLDPQRDWKAHTDEDVLFRPEGVRLHSFFAAEAREKAQRREELLSLFQVLVTLFSWPQNVANIRSVHGDVFFPFLLNCCGQFGSKLVEIASTADVGDRCDKNDNTTGNNNKNSNDAKSDSHAEIVFSMYALLSLVRLVSASLLFTQSTDIYDLLPPQPWTQEDTQRILLTAAAGAGSTESEGESMQSSLSALSLSTVREDTATAAASPGVRALPSSSLLVLRNDIRADWASLGGFHALESLLQTLLQLSQLSLIAGAVSIERVAVSESVSLSEALCAQLRERATLCHVLQTEILHLLAQAMQQNAEVCASLFEEVSLSDLMHTLLCETERETASMCSAEVSCADALRIRMQLLCLRVNASLMRQHEEENEGEREKDSHSERERESSECGTHIPVAQVARLLVSLQRRFHAVESLRDWVSFSRTHSDNKDNDKKIDDTNDKTVDNSSIKNDNNNSSSSSSSSSSSNTNELRASPLLRFEFTERVGRSATQHDLWPWTFSGPSHHTKHSPTHAHTHSHDFHVLAKDVVVSLSAKVKAQTGYTLWDAVVCELLGSHALSTARVCVNQGAKLSRSRLRFVFQSFRDAFADPLFLPVSLCESECGEDGSEEEEEESEGVSESVCATIPLGQIKFVDFISQLFKAAEAEDIFCVLTETDVFSLLLGERFLCAYGALLAQPERAFTATEVRALSTDGGLTQLCLASPRVSVEGLVGWCLLHNSVLDYLHGLVIYSIYFQTSSASSSVPSSSPSKRETRSVVLGHEDIMLILTHRTSELAHLTHITTQRAHTHAHTLQEREHAPHAVYLLGKLLLSLHDIVLSMTLSHYRRDAHHRLLTVLLRTVETLSRTRCALSSPFPLPSSVYSASSPASVCELAMANAAANTAAELLLSLFSTSASSSGPQTSSMASSSSVSMADAARDWLEVFLRDDQYRTVDILLDPLRSHTQSQTQSQTQGQTVGQLRRRRSQSARLHPSLSLSSSPSTVSVGGAVGVSVSVSAKTPEENSKYHSLSHSNTNAGTNTNTSISTTVNASSGGSTAGKLRGSVLSLLAMFADAELHLAALQMMQSVLIACAQETLSLDIRAHSTPATVSVSVSATVLPSSSLSLEQTRREKQSLRALAAEIMGALLLYVALAHKHAHVKTSVSLSLAALHSLISLLRDPRLLSLRMTFQDCVRRENLLYEMLRAFARCLNGLDVLKQRAFSLSHTQAHTQTHTQAQAQEMESLSAQLMRACLSLLTASVAGNDACKNVLSLLLQANREKMVNSSNSSSNNNNTNNNSGRKSVRNKSSTVGDAAVVSSSSVSSASPAAAAASGNASTAKTPAATTMTTTVASGLTSMILCGERSPSKETIAVFIDLLLDGPHAGACFLSLFPSHALSHGTQGAHTQETAAAQKRDSSAAMFTSDEDRPKICNAALLPDFFQLLPHCSEETQLFALDSFKQLVSGRGSLINLNVCCASRPKVLDIALDLFPFLPDRAQSSNAELVELLGRHSISVASLKHLFRALQQTEGRKHPYSWKIIQALQGMFLHESGPKHTFVFDGTNSGLRLPVVHRWPSMRGFAFCCWLRVESPKHRHTQTHTETERETETSYAPFILSLREPGGSGLELFLTKSTDNNSKTNTNAFRLVLRNHAENGEVSTFIVSEKEKQKEKEKDSEREREDRNNKRGRDKDKEREKERDRDASLQVSEDKWHFLGVSLSPSSFYGKGEAICAVNHRVARQEFSFSKLPDNALPLIGDCVREHSPTHSHAHTHTHSHTHTHTHTQTQSTHAHTLRGQMGALYFFSEAVTEAQLRGVCALGPDYAYNFEPSSADFNKDLSSHTTGNNTSTHNVLEDGVLASKLMLTYNPVVLRGKYFLDNTPEKNEVKWRVPAQAVNELADELRADNARYCRMHAIRLPGTFRSTTQSARLALGSLGGIKAILPLFAQLDQSLSDEKEKQAKNNEIDNDSALAIRSPSPSLSHTHSQSVSLSPSERQNEANFFPAVLGLFTTLLEDSPENLRSFARVGGFPTVRYLLDRADPRNFNLITFNQLAALYLKLERRERERESDRDRDRDREAQRDTMQDAVLEHVLCNFKLWSCAQCEVQCFLIDWLVFTFRTDAHVYPQALGVQRLLDVLQQFYEYEEEGNNNNNNSNNENANSTDCTCDSAASAAANVITDSDDNNNSSENNGDNTDSTDSSTDTDTETKRVLRGKMFSLLKVSLRRRALPDDVLSLLRYLCTTRTDRARQEVLLFLVDVLVDRELRERLLPLLLGFLTQDTRALTLLQSVLVVETTGEDVKLLILLLFALVLAQMKTHWAALAMLYIQYSTEGVAAIHAHTGTQTATQTSALSGDATRVHSNSADESMLCDVESFKQSPKASHKQTQAQAQPRTHTHTGGVTSPANLMHGSGLMQRSLSLLSAAVDSLFAQSSSVSLLSHDTLFSLLQDMLFGASPERFAAVLREKLQLSQSKLPSLLTTTMSSSSRSEKSNKNNNNNSNNNNNVLFAFPFVFFSILRTCCCSPSVLEGERERVLGELLEVLRPFTAEQALGVTGWQDEIAAALQSLFLTHREKLVASPAPTEGTECVSVETLLRILARLTTLSLQLGKTVDLHYVVSPAALCVPVDAQFEVYSRIHRGERFVGMTAVRDLAHAIEAHVHDVSFKCFLLFHTLLHSIAAVKAQLRVDVHAAYDVSESVHVHRRNVWLIGSLLVEFFEVMDAQLLDCSAADNDNNNHSDSDSNSSSNAASEPLNSWTAVARLFSVREGVAARERLQLVGSLVRAYIEFSADIDTHTEKENASVNGANVSPLLVLPPSPLCPLTALLQEQRLRHGSECVCEVELDVDLRSERGSLSPTQRDTRSNKLTAHRDTRFAIGGAAWLSLLLLYKHVSLCAKARCATEEVLPLLLLVPSLLDQQQKGSGGNANANNNANLCVFERLYLCAFVSLSLATHPSVVRESAVWPALRETVCACLNTYKYELLLLARPVADRILRRERERLSQSSTDSQSRKESLAVPQTDRNKEDTDERLAVMAKLLDSHISLSQCRSFPQTHTPSQSLSSTVEPAERLFGVPLSVAAHTQPLTQRESVSESAGENESESDGMSVCVRELSIHTTLDANSLKSLSLSLSLCVLWRELCEFIVDFRDFVEQEMIPARMRELGLADFVFSAQRDFFSASVDPHTHTEAGETLTQIQTQALTRAHILTEAHAVLSSVRESESVRVQEHLRSLSHALRRNELKWARIFAQLANERGPWGYGADYTVREVFWTLDTLENDRHLRLRMRRNPHGTRHMIASLKSAGIDSVKEQAAALSSLEDASQSLSGIYADLRKYKKRIVLEQAEEVREGEEGSANNGVNNNNDALSDGEEDDNNNENNNANNALADNESASAALSLSLSVEIITPASNPSGGKTPGRLDLSRNKLGFFRAQENRDYDFANKTGNAEFLWACESFPSTVWPANEIASVYRRHYQTRYVALEVFFTNRTCIFINCFEKASAKKAYRFLLHRAKCVNMHNLYTGKPALAMGKIFTHNGLSLTQAWEQRKISNFDYLMHLNFIAGRSFQDLAQYPVFPWVIADYSSPKIDLKDPRIYRRFDRPMAAQLDSQHEMLREKYESCEQLQDDGFFPYHTGSHFSTSAMVIWFLLRLEPYTSYHVWLQDGKFDRPDRLFHSIEHTYSGCTTNPQDVKELIPEFFCNPEFLYNTNLCEFGRRQCGEYIHDVTLPRWCRDATEFIRINRDALESEYVSANLHHWIDLVFGCKQRPPFLSGGSRKAVSALNVFVHLSYIDAVDLEAMKKSDPPLYNRTIRQIDSYGQTPVQLFTKEHPRRKSLLEVQDLIWPVASVVLGADTIPRSSQNNNNSSGNNGGAVVNNSSGNNVNTAAGNNTTAVNSTSNSNNNNSSGAGEEVTLEKPTRVLCYGEFKISNHPILCLCELTHSERLVTVDSARVLGTHTFTHRQPDNVPPFSLKLDRAALQQSSHNTHSTHGTNKSSSLSLSSMLPVSLSLSAYSAAKEKTIGIPFAAAVVLSGSVIGVERASESDVLEALGTRENRIKYLREETRALRSNNHSTASAAHSPSAHSSLSLRSAANSSSSNSNRRMPQTLSHSQSMNSMAFAQAISATESVRGGTRSEKDAHTLSTDSLSVRSTRTDTLTESIHSAHSHSTQSSSTNNNNNNNNNKSSTAKRERVDEHLSPHLFCVLYTHTHTHSTHNPHNAYTQSTQQRPLLISAGHWDNTFKISSLSDSGRLLQSLSHHREVVTCVAAASDMGRHWVVAGSKDCTLTVWEIFPERESEPANPSPLHTLYGHDDAVNCVAVNGELDVIVSGSDDGTIMVHTLREGAYIRSITLGTGAQPSMASVPVARQWALSGEDSSAPRTPRSAASSSSSYSSPPGPASSSVGTISAPEKLRRVHAVLISKEGYLLGYSHDGYVLASYTLNGRFLRLAQVREKLYALILSEDGRVVLTGGERGLVVMRWAHNLTIADTGPRRGLEAVLDGSNEGEFAPIASPIRSMALSAGERHLIVGLESGEIRVLAQDSEYLRRKLHRRLMEIGILSM